MRIYKSIDLSLSRAKDSLAVQRPSSVARRVISPSQTTGNIEISATIQGVEKASKPKGVRAKSSLSIDIIICIYSNGQLLAPVSGAASASMAAQPRLEAMMPLHAAGEK